MQGEFYSRGYSFRYSIMISALEWIPAGVADPNPKKYEFSAAEMELIAMMEKQNFDDSQVEEAQMEVKKKKMTFGAFLNALQNVATKVYPKEEGAVGLSSANEG